MASVNKVILIGNLTRDPELRYTPKGNAVTEVGLAMNRRYRVDNELREETTFVDVTFWGATAENISKYMQKGRPIYVEGRLQLDSWDDKTTGQKRSKLRVVGEVCQFLGSPQGSSGGPMAQQGSGGGGQYNSGPAQSAAPAQSAPPAQTPTSSGPLPVDDDEEDDIPF